MRIFSNLLPILFLLISMSAFADDNLKKSIEPHIALKAVQMFRADPGAENAKSLLAVIVNFAEHSEDVIVTIDDNYFPGEFSSLKSKNMQILLGAYVAGNIEKQLLTGVKLDSPAEGIELMLFSYLVLQHSGAMEKHATFEEWVHLNSIGELRVARR